MKPQDVVKHFGSQAAAAKALGLGRAAVWAWIDRGGIPETRQYQIEVLTKGKLKADKPVAA